MARKCFLILDALESTPGCADHFLPKNGIRSAGISCCKCGDQRLGVLHGDGYFLVLLPGMHHRRTTFSLDDAHFGDVVDEIPFFKFLKSLMNPHRSNPAANTLNVPIRRKEGQAGSVLIRVGRRPQKCCELFRQLQSLQSSWTPRRKSSERQDRKKYPRWRANSPATCFASS